MYNDPNGTPHFAGRRYTEEDISILTAVQLYRDGLMTVDELVTLHHIDKKKLEAALAYAGLKDPAPADPDDTTTENSASDIQRGYFLRKLMRNPLSR